MDHVDKLIFIIWRTFRQAECDKYIAHFQLFKNTSMVAYGPLRGDTSGDTILSAFYYEIYEIKFYHRLTLSNKLRKTPIMRNNYFTYIVKCSDDSYYTGVTNNLDRRIVEHNDKFNPRSYTFSRRPVLLVFSEAFSEIDQAISFEKRIKGWSRKKKEAIIANEWQKLPALSKNKIAKEERK